MSDTNVHKHIHNWCWHCAHCDKLPRTAAHTNTPEHYCWQVCARGTLALNTATHCNTLQHTATHCNTLTYPVRGSLRVLCLIVAHRRIERLHEKISKVRSHLNLPCEMTISADFWEILLVSGTPADGEAVNEYLKSQITSEFTMRNHYQSWILKSCVRWRHTSGWITLQHTSGWITLQHTSGWITLQHTSGWITLQHISGWITLQHISGWITLQHTSGWITLQHTSGWITLQHTSRWIG